MIEKELPEVDALAGYENLKRDIRRDVRRRRALIAAAAVVLVGGGAYAVTQIDSATDRSGPAIVHKPSPSPELTPVPPGNHEQVGLDNQSSLPISIVVPKSATLFGGGTGVTSGENPDAVHAGLHVFQARTLAGGSSGCYNDNWSARGRQAADTARALARQLAGLPRSTITQPLTPTTAFGYHAFHLRLRVNNGCPGGPGYMVAEADSDFGIAYSRVPKDVVIDFLVVDVDRTPIVVGLWHEADASSQLVHRATRVRDAITFVPGQ